MFCCFLCVAHQEGIDINMMALLLYCDIIESVAQHSSSKENVIFVDEICHNQTTNMEDDMIKTEETRYKTQIVPLKAIIPRASRHLYINFFTFTCIRAVCE